VGERLAFLVKRSGEPEFVTFVEAFGVTSPTKFSNVRLRQGDTVMLRSPSGGGYGPPWERPVGRVLADVANGFISVERARLDYGVAVRADGAVDDETTNALRREMADGVG
jgi:N-methylhydantoinase B